MVPSILATKLHVPQHRDGLIARHRLVEQLDQALQRKMMLISAPAGYGKTTLVSEWVHGLGDRREDNEPVRVAWLSVDEADNDTQRFLVGVTTSLNRAGGVGESIGAEALELARSPQPEPGRVILTSLINDIDRASGHFILVIDDYHLIESHEVDDLLAFFVTHVPPSLHVIVATRSDPNIRLARLRAGNDMAELRATDLRFTDEEAVLLLRQTMGLSLSKENVALLEATTGGWIAGLHLAAISMQGREASGPVMPPRGSNRYIVDYLLEEVLSRQSQEVRQFLLDTSVLDNMTGSLCDALTGRGDGTQMLAALEHENLFISSLDSEQCWYRYHRLFADLLRTRLDQTEPTRRRALHRRAAFWWAENGVMDRAIEHALRCEDREWAASMIEDRVDAMWQQGEAATAWGWLQKLPTELRMSRPLGCIFSAYYLHVGGEERRGRTVSTSRRTVARITGTG